MRINKVVRVSLSGGLIGLLFTNPRAALQRRIQEENENGWTATHLDVHSDRNVLVWLLQLIVLVLTLFLWTWGAGYLVLFERETDA